ncbi:hypothetical protein A1355_18940 [Methylomonas koyamae]|uniref:Uncharacterized protein n=1 Tax=Methylomonas koyamae TaxID=702114 RepID=A0A177PAN2_9GAMM|nr:hypothetical protein A1355_18940 [Methylomonas koyamae]
MMVSLTRNLMIRRGMSPLKEGVRLHFMNYLPIGMFSELAASSNRLLKFKNLLHFYPKNAFPAKQNPVSH